jgi:hypothetical protein
MVLLSGTFTVLSRLIGAIAGKTLGWVVILLFGRVPQSRQHLLSSMALGSIVWLVAVVAVLVPLANELLVAAVPRPGFVQRDWIRLALIGAALLLPAVVGATMTALSPEDAREGPLGRIGQVIRGYPFTAVLAGTIVFLAAWGLVRVAKAMRRGWQNVHLPMMVKPGRYEAVADDIEKALARAGVDVVCRPASPWFVVPPRLLAFVGGTRVGGLVPDELIGFGARDLGILVYPSDVAIVGRADLVAQARSAVVRCLTFTDAYLTTARESEKIEDRLRELSRRPFVQSMDFEPIDALLTSLAVPSDEWETLFRLRLQVEHETLVTGAAPVARRV